MNILMLSGNRLVAAGKKDPFYFMLAGFSKYWDRIDVICPKPKRATINQIHNNVFFYPSPFGRLLQPLYILYTGLKLIKRRKYHLIISQDYGLFYNGIGAFMLQNKFKIPWVSELHHVEGFPRYYGFRSFVYKTIAKLYVYFASKKVNVFRVVCEQLRGLLMGWKVCSEKIKTLNSLYIDRNIFYPHRDITKEIDIIFCGRLEKQKGLDIILKALMLIKKNKKDIKALLIGNGSLKNRIVRFIEKNDLKDSIRIIEWIDDNKELAAFYNKSKILVSSSFSEGNPRVVAEAMACGVPVITTPVGIVPEIIKDGENGMIFNWDPGELASKVITLLGNEETHRQISEAACCTIKHFEYETAIQNLATEYKNIGSNKINRKYKVAIAGTGDFAHQHAKQLMRLKNAKLVAVFSRTAERASKFAGVYSINGYADFDDMITKEKPDVIDIVTINSLHAPLGIEAATRGVHVIVEKPIATNVKEAVALIESCKNNNVNLFVVSQLRYSTCFMDLKRKIESGFLGHAIRGRVDVSYKRFQDYFDMSKWRGSKKEAGGGVLINQAIHYIDLLIWLFGDIDYIKASTATLRHDIEVEDMASCVFKFKNGTEIIFNADTNSAFHKPASILLYGSEGMCLVEGTKAVFHKKVYFLDKMVLSYKRSGLKLRHFFDMGKDDFLKTQFEDIFNNIEKGDTASNAETAVKALEAVMACYKSDDTKEKVLI